MAAKRRKRKTKNRGSKGHRLSKILKRMQMIPAIHTKEGQKKLHALERLYIRVEDD